MSDLDDTTAYLQAEWGLELPNTLSEAAIIEKLADRVVVLLERGQQAFFQMMYRLDISEKKLEAILNEPDVAHQIARLIYDRQTQKVASRKAYAKNSPAPEPGLEW